MADDKNDDAYYSWQIVVARASLNLLIMRLFGSSFKRLLFLRNQILRINTTSDGLSECLGLNFGSSTVSIDSTGDYCLPLDSYN